MSEADLKSIPTASNSSPMSPCPFCGDVQATVFEHFKDAHYFYVNCIGCDAEGPPATSFKEARDSWNIRARLSRVNVPSEATSEPAATEPQGSAGESPAPSTLVKKLRDAFAEFADDIGPISILLTDAADEIDRLTKWADGFSDRQLEERRTGEAYQRELRGEVEWLTEDRDFWKAEAARWQETAHKVEEEIERLTRERDEARNASVPSSAVIFATLEAERDQWHERHDRERATHAANLKEQQKCEAQRDRLRAALQSIARQLSGYAEYSPAREMARIAATALAGEPIETSHPQAPIACLTIDRAGEVAGVSLYAPGLPPGEHDLFCEPLSTVPSLSQQLVERGFPKREPLPDDDPEKSTPTAEPGDLK